MALESGSTEIVAISLADGGSVFVKALDPFAPEGVVRSARRSTGAIQKSKRSFADSITQSITAITDSMIQAVQRQKISPSKASIEFGLEFIFNSGDIEVVLVKGIDNAHVRISLEWEQREPDA